MIFTAVAGILIYAKADTDGFNILWRYFSWANESTAVFAFSMICIYMMKNKMPYIMALIPGMFYMYVVASYILNARIGFNLPWTASYITAGIVTVAYGAVLVLYGRKQKLHSPADRNGG